MRAWTCLVPLLCTQLGAAPTVLVEWRFDADGDLQGWGGANHVAELRVEDRAMQGRIMDWDPFVRGPQFEIPATPWQRIELRLKTDCGGSAEFFWSNTTESPYGGFSPGKETHFEVVGDARWHEYDIYPFWHTEEKIILMRLDLPKPDEQDNGKKTFAVDFIRVVDLGQPKPHTGPPEWDLGAGPAGWAAREDVSMETVEAGLQVTMGESARGWIQSPPIRHVSDEAFYVSIDMAVDKGRTGAVRWVSSQESNLCSHKVMLRPDGRFHTYNVDMSASQQWRGDVLMLGLTPTTSPGSKAVIRRIVLADVPQGGADLEVVYAGLENAINRAGAPLPFVLSLNNRGGQAARGLRMVGLDLPPEVSVRRRRGWDELPVVEPFEPTIHRFHLVASKPVEGNVAFRLAGAGVPGTAVRAAISVTPALGLPKADYVPEPRPVESDYEIGAFYFPVWPAASKWEPIRRVGPDRKPVLGWYDESNPECADWQIKWAVENGISFFLVDWYWSAGGRSLTHWVENAYAKARYRSLLKWCMMWANHNAAGSHSEDDQKNVTKYWIDNTVIP